MGNKGDDSEDEINETELLHIAREEAQRTLDKQIENINDIDTKAAKILRLNLVLIGILLSGVSIIATTNGSNEPIGSASELLNLYTLIGTGSLLISTILAAFTYTAASQRGGMSGRDIQKMINNDYSPQQNYRGIVESYSNWLQYNFRINTRSVPLATGMLLFLIYGILLISAGSLHALVVDLGYGGFVILILLFILITRRSGIKGQISRYWRYREDNSGQD